MSQYVSSDSEIHYSLSSNTSTLLVSTSLTARISCSSSSLLLCITLKITAVVLYYLLGFGCFLPVEQATLRQLGQEKLQQEELAHSFLQMNVNLN